MPITIPNAYVETFESNVRHLAQQGDSRLRPYVTEVNNQSKAHHWDRLAESAARTRTSNRQVSPAGGSGSGAIDTTDGLDWSRRNTLIQTFDWGEIVAPAEIAQMLIDPLSSVTTNGAMAMKRAVDDVIIANALADALTDGGANAIFPAGQKIGTGLEELSTDIILQVDELFLTNDVDQDERKCFVIGPVQKRAMLSTMQVTSADYAAGQALATGYLPNWMGFDWIVSNRLEVPGAGEISCLAFSKKALGLHVASDITAKVGERTDMSFAIQVFLEMNMDCVRVEDEHIVHIHLKNSFTPS